MSIQDPIRLVLEVKVASDLSTLEAIDFIMELVEKAREQGELLQASMIMPATTVDLL